MNINTALDILNPDCTFAPVNYEMQAEADRMGYEALRKHKPMKWNVYIANEQHVYECPACTYATYLKNNYCANCGQRLET